MSRPAAGYELLEHTADVGVRARGSTLEAAFEQETRKKRVDLQATKRQLEDQERLLERKAAAILLAFSTTCSIVPTI